MTSVLVTGGRHYADGVSLYKVMDRLHAELSFAMLIHGNAKGADLLADNWAKARKVQTWRFPVSKGDWDKIGLSAGPKRNTKMLMESKPDYVVAFPGGNGTSDMVNKAVAAGYRIMDEYGWARRYGVRVFRKGNAYGFQEKPRELLASEYSGQAQAMGPAAGQQPSATRDREPVSERTDDLPLA